MKKSKNTNIFKRRQIQIAKQTVRMPPELAAVMGGPTVEEAIAFLKSEGIPVDSE